MEKRCHSSDPSRTDPFLRQLNRASLKISKPSKKPAIDGPQQSSQAPSPAPDSVGSLPHHQPPVYNIDKSDFRDVVQKLTGSPAHERLTTPPPIHPPKPQSSRLQRIRPPPLPHLAARPSATASLNFPGFEPRAAVSAPFSPLPPLPTVSAAAESPITAYMRCLRGSTHGDLSGLPIGFGSVGFPAPPPGPLLSPTFLFPSASFAGLPSSPTIPILSPRWRNN